MRGRTDFGRRGHEYWTRSTSRILECLEACGGQVERRKWRLLLRAVDTLMGVDGDRIFAAKSVVEFVDDRGENAGHKSASSVASKRSRLSESMGITDNLVGS